MPLRIRELPEAPEAGIDRRKGKMEDYHVHTIFRYRPLTGLHA